MAGERPRDLLTSGTDEEGPPLLLGRVGSAIAAATAVQLLLAVAVVADRNRDTDRGTSTRPAASRRASPIPSPSPSPREPVFGEEAGARRRIALSTARFAARQECPDTTGFAFTIVESTADLLESVVWARRPDSDIVVKVTLLPQGGISYVVLSEFGGCDA